jgi:elongation factor G
VIGDMNSRRGRVQTVDSNGAYSIISVFVPLSEVLRYGNDLRAMSGGRGLYTQAFYHYEQLPSHLAQPLIDAHAKHQEA